jgi:hypothetical protein
MPLTRPNVDSVPTSVPTPVTGSVTGTPGVTPPGAPTFYDIELAAGIVQYRVDLAATVKYAINLGPITTNNVVNGANNVINGANNVVNG